MKTDYILGTQEHADAYFKEKYPCEVTHQDLLKETFAQQFWYPPCGFKRGQLEVYLADSAPISSVITETLSCPICNNTGVHPKLRSICACSDVRQKE